MNYSIAVDGPAGAGKSTIAKRIAKELNFIYVDTGAMYRAMSIYFLDNGVNPMEEDKITKACDNINIQIVYKDDVQQVILNGENVTGRLRMEEVGKMASKISVYNAVRTNNGTDFSMLEYQQISRSEKYRLREGSDYPMVFATLCFWNENGMTVTKSQHPPGDIV